jgi:hypothetical protein
VPSVICNVANVLHTRSHKALTLGSIVLKNNAASLQIVQATHIPTAILHHIEQFPRHDHPDDPFLGHFHPSIITPDLQRTRCELLLRRRPSSPLSDAQAAHTPYSHISPIQIFIDHHHLPSATLTHAHPLFARVAHPILSTFKLPQRNSFTCTSIQSHSNLPEI